MPKPKLKSKPTKIRTSHLAKLTPRQVRWVRKNADTLSQESMAKRLDVSQATISMILRGLVYKHVA